MNELIEEHYLKYFECLNNNDKDICNNIYLNNQPPLKQKTKQQDYKQTWVFVNRGNFIKK
tara:strand:+ start:957 stop:1136 length:180 start_codon:yes stop_codon:yes gene_type:complete